MSSVLVEQHGNGVLELALNRPEKKNALTLAMYAELVAQLQRAAEDTQVRVVILRGEGDSFTAGNDLADFMAGVQNADGMDTILGFLHCLVDFPKPLIALVQGNAVGIGTTLLLHCDHVIAADNLKARLPFVQLGLVPEGGSSLLLPMMLGHRKASELLISGTLIDAESACRLGIANEQVAAEQLLARGIDVAGRYAALPVEAARQSKAMLKAPWRAQLHRVIDEEGQQFAARLDSDEARSIMASFFTRK